MQLLADKVVGEGPQLSGDRVAQHVKEKGLHDGSRHAVRRELMVPDSQEVESPLGVLTGGLKAENVLGQLSAGDGVEVALYDPKVLQRVLLLGLQQLHDALDAVAVHVLGAQEVGVVVVHGLVVRRGHVVRGRIEDRRQLVEGDEALPVVLPRPTRRGHQPLALGSQGHQAGHLIADVALHIGVDEVLSGRWPMTHGLAELLPVASPVQQEDGLGVLAGLGHHRAQRQRSLLAGDTRADDRPVAGHQDLLHHRLAPTAHADLLPHDLAVHPLAAGLVLTRVLGVDPLHEQVIAVGHGIGDAPGDAIVVADDDPRHAGNGGADHIGAAAVEMHLVPDVGHLQGQVGIVGQQRLARRRFRAVHRPVVAAAPSGTGQLLHLAQLLQQRRSQAAALSPRRDDKRRPYRIARLHTGGLLRTQPLHYPRADDLSVPVAGETPAHELADGQAVHGRPAVGSVAEDDELRRQAIPVPVDEGVDPLRIGLQVLAHRLRQLLQFSLSGATQPHPPQQAVGLQGHRPEYFG